MERYAGMCEPMCAVNLAAHISWLQAIPLGEWPQQDRMSADCQYPAMVTNPEWCGFGNRFHDLVTELMFNFPKHVAVNKYLSIVMPKQCILDHDDVFDEPWRVRIHVPLITNPQATMWFGQEVFHMEVGTAYKVNTEINHGLANMGDEPRIHFFFDVRAQ